MKYNYYKVEEVWCVFYLFQGWQVCYGFSSFFQGKPLVYSTFDWCDDFMGGKGCLVLVKLNSVKPNFLSGEGEKVYDIIFKRVRCKRCLEKRNDMERKNGKTTRSYFLDNVVNERPNRFDFFTWKKDVFQFFSFGHAEAAHIFWVQSGRV